MQMGAHEDVRGGVSQPTADAVGGVLFAGRGPLLFTDVNTAQDAFRALSQPEFQPGQAATPRPSRGW